MPGQPIEMSSIAGGFGDASAPARFERPGRSIERAAPMRDETADFEATELKSGRCKPVRRVECPGRQKSGPGHFVECNLPAEVMPRARGRAAPRALDWVSGAGPSARNAGPRA